MKKCSRVGKNFQAPIPPLLSVKEQEESRKKYLRSRPHPRSTTNRGTLNSLQLEVTQSKLSNINGLSRLNEQPIPTPITPYTPQLSKKLYAKVVAKARQQHQAAQETRRLQMLNRRKSTRPRGMRGQRYRDWGDSDNSFDEFSPEPSSLSPDEKPNAQRKKRARSSKRAKPVKLKTRYVPNRIKPVVIDLVNSDTDDTPNRKTKRFRRGPPGGAYYRTNPQNRLIHTLQRALYPYISRPSSLYGKRASTSRVQYGVLNNFAVSQLSFQSPRPAKKVLGKLMGYRQSPTNSMIPVIEL